MFWTLVHLINFRTFCQTPQAEITGAKLLDFGLLFSLATTGELMG
jgi:hypothetical protein